MSTIIVDLDHTLLNTTAFKSALAKSLDMSIGDFERVYEQFIRDNGVFRPKVFLAGATVEQKRAFNQVLKRLRTFLYTDSMPFLKAAHQAGYRVVVITFGDVVWQKQKLRALHLPDYVQTIVTEEAKTPHLAQYIDRDTLVVDDHARELELFAKEWPQLTLYWMQRPDGKYRDAPPNVPHLPIHSINEIKL